MSFNATEFARYYDHHPDESVAELLESIGPRIHDPNFKNTMPRSKFKVNAEPQILPDDFSILELAEAIMGEEWVNGLGRKKSGRFVNRTELTESDAVKLQHFTNITGQIFYSTILEGWQTEQAVFTSMVESIQTDIADMEKIPGISEIGDEVETVDEAAEYEMAGVSENYIQTAEKVKRGRIVPVTKEAVAFDRTGKLLERCRNIGMWAKINLEKRIIDALIDENAGAKSAVLGGHRYHWRGTSYATYQTSSPWINVTTSNGLVDYTDVEAAWLKFMDMTDPFTGEPIELMPDFIAVTPQNAVTAARIMKSIQNRYDTNQSAGTASTITISDNLVKMVIGDLHILTSRQLKARAATDTDWWMGNMKALVRLYNWDITPDEADTSSREAFHRDIIHQFKVSMRDIVSVREPRLLHESRA